MKVKIIPDKKVDKQIVIVGIVALLILEIFAMSKGFNGTLLKIVIVLIALSMGIAIPTPKILK